MGAVAPHGHSVAEIWPRVRSGEPAVARIAAYDPAGHVCQIAAEVPPGFSSPASAGPIALGYRAIQFLWGAAHEALQESGDASAAGQHHPRRGAIVTTGVSQTTLGAFGGSMVRTLGLGADPWRADLDGFFARISTAPEVASLGDFLLEEAGPLLAWMNGAGRCWNVASACAAGSQALADAAAMIARDEADQVLVGGVCTGINPFMVNGFAILGALSCRNDEPAAASRPFDRDRDGFVMAEGAAAMVLEREDHARARGAPVLARLAGWGLSCDGYRLTDPRPDGSGMRMAMERALARARLRPDDIDYVNAHGTSTPYNDAAESAALKTVFGERSPQLPVSSSKSMFGHMIQAAGIMEAIVCVRALDEGFAPPTINHDHPDPACGLDVIPNRGRALPMRWVMSNSFGFGGQNATVILGQP
jgi:3-oxoacyl-[acyl-carrier-protein] synthase II